MRTSRRRKFLKQKKNGNKDLPLKTIIFVTAILKLIKAIKDLIN